MTNTIARNVLALLPITTMVAALVAPNGVIDAHGQQVVVERGSSAATIDYYRPRIAAAPDGSYAVAWEALVEGEFVTEWQIAVQRYSATGAAVGPVNYFEPESGCLDFDSWLSDGQQNVELAFDDSGHLLVFMEHFGEYSIIVDASQSSEITLGIIDQNGLIVDQSNRANCVQWKFIFPGADEQDRPRVVMLPGGFAVVMDGFFGGTNFRNIGLQLFDQSLSAVGDVVIPHDDPDSQVGFHSYADVATNGSVIAVTWHECPFSDPQGNVSECDAVAQFAQVSGATLTGIGTNIRANAGDPAGTWNTRPAVAMSPQGNSVIVWQDTRNRAGGDVFGQRFDVAGQPVGDNFQISQNGSSLEFWPGIRPEVAMRNDGSFMVVWSDSLNGAWRALGRQYDSDGQATGNAELLASGADTDFIMPAVDTDGTSYYYTGISRTNAGSLGIFSGAPTGTIAVEEGDVKAGGLSLDTYPNPFRHSATVVAHLPDANRLTVDVVDLLGRVIYRADHGLMARGTHELVIDTSGWSSGLYVFRVTYGDNSVSRVVTKSE